MPFEEFDPLGLQRRSEPEIGSAPDTVRGFRIRLDLMGTKPPVWRRIDLPGDMRLSRLHEVIQTTMGWTDSHLHRFRIGAGFDSAEFLTEFDRAEGDEGVPEDDVRLDQIVSGKGGRLWYDYDFGDGWEHVLKIEKVLDEPPSTPKCIAGRLACPPDDCGGIWGYQELAEWVRSDYREDRRPEVFADTEEALSWLPEGWHPDIFDIEETNALLGAGESERIQVTEEFASLLERARDRGSRSLRNALVLANSRGPVEFSADDTSALTQPFRELLEIIGDGVALTGAGYLKPAAVEEIAHHTGISGWWVGKANREDQTAPVAQLRAVVRSLGLITVRKGTLAPTRAGRACAQDPERLLQHILDRLPRGKATADRHAGWVTLAVIGSETPALRWHDLISTLMFELGWRDGRDGRGMPPPENPTLDVLRLMNGQLRAGKTSNGVAAVARVARAAM